MATTARKERRKLALAETAAVQLALDGQAAQVCDEPNGHNGNGNGRVDAAIAKAIVAERHNGSSNGRVKPPEADGRCRISVELRMLIDEYEKAVDKYEQLERKGLPRKDPLRPSAIGLADKQHVVWWGEWINRFKTHQEAHAYVNDVAWPDCVKNLAEGARRVRLSSPKALKA